MRYAVYLLIFLTCLADAAYPQGPTEGPPNGPDIDQITARIREINRSYESRDHRPFERYYLDSYVNIRNKVVFNIKEQLIAMMRSDSHILRSGRKPDHLTKSFRAENPDILVYNDVAVVYSAKLHEWEYRGSGCVTRFVATDLWIRDEGEWKLAAGAANTFHCDPLPWSRPHPAVAALGDRTTPPRSSDELASKVSSVLEAIVNEGPEDRIADEARFIGTDGESSKNADAMIALLRAAGDPAQRLSIDEEVYLPLPGGAIYTFCSKRRGDRGFIDRGSITQHFILFVEIDDRLKIAAAHSISTVD